jgi:glyoxylase-like metal-dependent hydrolase (beta-lactamase superfamily II)
MAAIRYPGKINENTTLIDIGMYGVAGAAAVYLVEDDKKCLVDGGTRTEASRLVKTLRQMDAFPLDIIIATHAHYDHVQGIPLLRKEAARKGKRIEVLASQKAIPLLEDQSYNKVFDAGPYEGIQDVTPLKEGDTVDLGGITLRIYEVPGHSEDHIAILDEKNRNIFVGDAIGDKVGDDTFLPPFMPPSWDPDAFLSSINKLKQVDYESLCLSHFGYIYGDEAKSILDEAVLTCETWWQLFERNAAKLDDVDYMLEVVLKEIAPGIPEIRILSLKLKVLFGLMTGWRKLVRQRPQPIGELLLRGILEQLAKGYKTYKNP